MADQSKYGKWESQGEQVDAKLWDIASRHHAFPSVYGIQCMCGARPGTNRGFTEHVIDMTVKATAHDAEKRAEWEAEQGEPEWEYGFELIESDTRDVLDRSGSFDNEPAARHWAKVTHERESDPEFPPLDILIVRRRKAGPWLPIPDTTNHETTGENDV